MTLVFVLALLIALVDEARAEGRSLTGWAVILICLGLLWDWFGTAL